MTLNESLGLGITEETSTFSDRFISSTHAPIHSNKKRSSKLKYFQFQTPKLRIKTELYYETKTRLKDFFSFKRETIQVPQTRDIIQVEYQTGAAHYFEENLNENVALEMVSIPGGSFLMGSLSSEEESNESERPQHWVNIKPFYLGKYPVTQAQYEIVMGTNNSHFPGANRPVENISWYDAQAFCQELSAITGQTYRLPSEAEWEYACRAGSTTPFYFGEVMTSDLANYDGTYIYRRGEKGVYRGETTNVDIFPPNAYGLYDMHGNVWEWCEDAWHQSYDTAPSDGSAWVTESNPSLRLLRGGSWNPYSWVCRCAHRIKDYVAFRTSFYGFRVALSC